MPHMRQFAAISMASKR